MGKKQVMNFLFILIPPAHPYHPPYKLPYDTRKQTAPEQEKKSSKKSLEKITKLTKKKPKLLCTVDSKLYVLYCPSPKVYIPSYIKCKIQCIKEKRI